MAKAKYGDNVMAEVKGNKLLIEVDLSVDLGLSKSGKSRSIGTTRGNTRITLPDGNTVTLGLNCYRKADES